MFGAEDLSTMFDATEFAEQATIALPADGAGRVLVGIFDSAYLVLDLGSGVESTAPAFTLPDSSIPDVMADAITAGDDVALEIQGCVYNVVESKPDGTGVTVLRLRK